MITDLDNKGQLLNVTVLTYSLIKDPDQDVKTLSSLVQGL